MDLLAVSLAILAVILVVRVWMVLPIAQYYNLKKEKNEKITTMIVIGVGGHVSEMSTLLRGLDHTRYTPRHYVIADTDITSLPFVKTMERITSDSLLQEALSKEQFHIHYIPRAREVGQSYISSVWTTLKALIFTVFVICKTSPELLITNGPGTCFPVIMAMYIPRLLGRKSMIIYIESICRVTDLSLCGKLVYPFVDKMVVQWQDLKRKYPKCDYYGMLALA